MLNAQPELKEAISKGKLLAFADDVLIMADNEIEATNMIEAFMKLEDSGLIMNKTKT